MTPEKNHSGTTVQKMKRVPFIVSQEYHNRNRKETIEEKAVPEKILHKPAETEQRMLEVKNSPKLKDEAKLVQKQVTKWFRRKPKDTGVEMEVIEDSKEEVVKEDTKVEKQEKSRSKRVTSKEDLQKIQPNLSRRFIVMKKLTPERQGGQSEQIEEIDTEEQKKQTPKRPAASVQKSIRKEWETLDEW